MSMKTLICSAALTGLMATSAAALGLSVSSSTDASVSASNSLDATASTSVQAAATNDADMSDMSSGTSFMGSVVLFADGTVAGTVDDVVVTADGSQQVIVQIADDVNTEADRFALTVDASASASSEITLGQTRAEFLTLMQAQMSTEG